MLTFCVTVSFCWRGYMYIRDVKDLCPTLLLRLLWLLPVHVVRHSVYDIHIRISGGDLLRV